ncbi:glutamate synthase large subunit [Euzebya sp.]|uniref:glutamate synthase large subunit n=1 Tax=Euzebya sp. TaxID=1971409 RepID=UPI003519A39F
MPGSAHPHARHAIDPRAERDACGIGFVANAGGTSSRRIVADALAGLAGVMHRGAVAADGRSGDGSGLLIPLPRTFLAAQVGAAGTTADPDRLGAAVLFLDPADTAAGDEARATARRAVADAIDRVGLTLLGWREVPTDPSVLGDIARAAMPHIVQALIERPADMAVDAAERACYLARKLAGAACAAAGAQLYVASWSFRTITYKGMSAADRLAELYPDLADDRVEAWFAIFHQRYSTNTSPTWARAQPFRFLCHNGEINTIQGNVNRMHARVGNLGADWPELGEGGEALLQPVLEPDGSDSAQLDAVLELLLRGGRSGEHAMRMLVPPVWEGSRDLPPSVTDFSRYHATLVEPWDGPAGLVFTDGERVGAALDRNGLRPIRTAVCEDGFVVASSEVGAVDLSGRGRVRRGRLGPGHMILVDPARGGVLENDAITTELARRRPYGRWLRENLVPLGPGLPVEHSPEDLTARQLVAGYTKEEEITVLRPMATSGKEPISSMGDDTQLSAFTGRTRTIYAYLKQRFAQVTNPPIDPIREAGAMSLRTLLGPQQPLLAEEPEAARLIELESFVIYPQGLQQLVLDPDIGFAVHGLDATWPVADGADGLAARLAELGEEAVAAVRDGAELLITSDRSAAADRVPVPGVLAVGAVHHALIRAQLRTRTSLIAETDDARDTHSYACLLGYGADAICPRLALESMARLADEGRVGRDNPSAGEVQELLKRAAEQGVLKIMSKMGISTVDAYRAAQVFEAVGLGPDVIDAALVGTPSTLGGVGLAELAADVLARHAEAHPETGSLPSHGRYKYKRGGESHATNPDVVSALHRAVGLEEPDGDRGAAYAAYAELVSSRPPTAPRDLLEWVPAAEPLPLDEVEPVSSITQRFFTGAMSLGALSPEAHETLAIAMNAVGGFSNCGEGGEDPARFASRGTAVDRNSKVKQVASGRFGVTPRYLAFADELQIKMAQGSKPGEGGQLPGHKVSALIARLRHTQPGVSLISPPPHHDIYSIEDLAQLIYDLKQVNPHASVSVKLVASAGVGTVAAGVVKGLADAIQISGADGGTGASPLSSIAHAGMPWEVGLADTQQTLVANALRSRVRLQVDGGFKSGRDVLIAALLGGDEFGFGTAALLAEGCIMVRACHRDTCPVGVATQRVDLRQKFAGTPEGVAAFMRFVAEEVRRGLAAMGLRSLDEAIGRVDLLRVRDGLDPATRAAHLDLSPLLVDARGSGLDTELAGTVGGDPDALRYVETLPIQAPRSPLGDRVFDEAFFTLWDGGMVSLRYDITNADRTVGARLGGAIGLEFGDRAPDGSATVHFDGQAGQSFGAFLSPGVRFELTGEANDYVGKGMAGGTIVIRPPADDVVHDGGPVPVLAGNTLLYGATGGELLVAGRVGERFAVRNSGADAVVEGTGEHACEYMTGGTVVILGETGFNLGAGMTGGECIVHDDSSWVLARVNTQLVEARRLDSEQLDRVRLMVERHVELTGSRRGAALLSDWEDAWRGFWRIAPKSEIAKVEAANEGSVGAPA